MSISSNEVFNISIAQPTHATTFKPKFTYPLFENEIIYGYKGLRIDLVFDCLSLYPFFNFKYDEKENNVVNIKEVFDKHVDSVFKDEGKWLDEIDNEKFQLPSDKVVGMFKDNEGKDYSIYKFDVTDPTGLKLLKRFQILSLLFIEGGSFIDTSDKNWGFYLVYQKSDDKDIFVGYSTVYKYWNFQSTKEVTKYKNRISQFVILPPYQGKGIGRELYNSIVEEWTKDDTCVEITVEDPNEEFDELRDKCDLQRKIASPCADLKLTKRQHARIEEMYQLYTNGSTKDLRLKIKKRIYLQNKDGLEGLDASMVKSKLQDAYESVMEGYQGVLGIHRGLKRPHDEA